MYQRIAQLFRLPALLLAAALQIMPIARAALPAAQATADVLAIVFRWAAGAAAVLGGVQAVSGASTVVTNPLSTNLVQGTSFVMRLTTAPNQATYWTATGLPTGISLVGTNGRSLWQLSGTPTVTGTFNVALTAFESQGSSHFTSATLVINISAAVNTPPAITTPPASLVVTQGQAASFSVTATGTAPLTYFWFKGSVLMTNGPNPVFSIANAQPTDAGTYSVIVSNSLGTATSSGATLTVIVPSTAPAISGQPASQSIVVGQNATFNVIATGSTPLNYFWRKGAVVITNSTVPSFTIANAQLTDAGTYSVIVSNSLGTATSSNATLTVNSVITAPAITTQPASQLVFQGQNALLSVAASGTGPLGYQWRRNGTRLTDTTHLVGTQSNLFTIVNALTNDSGRYSVVITNSAGSVTSQVATLTVTNPTVWTIAVQVVGNGTIAPNYNGQVLTIGNNYTMTAQPGTGYVFSKWTGGIYSTVPALTFVMQRALSLQANFIPTPFPPLMGTYSGLFYDTNGVTHPGSGLITINLTANTGAFNGTVQIGSSKWSLAGQFDATGNATVAVNRGIMTPLNAVLQLDMTGVSGQITGTVTANDNSWTAQLVANRAVFNAMTHPCPQAGNYTLLIPGTPGATQSPAGDGYGTVTVTKAGLVTLKATLADGTTASASTTLSQSGQWALYAPLYAFGRGSMIGWLTFTNTTGSDINGWLNWIRPVIPTTLQFTAGFSVMTAPIGSLYTSPASGNPILNMATGTIALSDGALAPGFTNQFQLNANNSIVNLERQRPATVIQHRQRHLQRQRPEPGHQQMDSVQGHCAGKTKRRRRLLPEPERKRRSLPGSNVAGEWRGRLAAAELIWGGERKPGGCGRTLCFASRPVCFLPAVAGAACRTAARQGQILSALLPNFGKPHPTAKPKQTAIRPKVASVTL